MKPIRIFEVIARRRMLIFVLLCVLITATSTGFGWNIYRTKKVKAVTSNHVMTNGEIIQQSDTTYDTTDANNYNIIIPAGVTAIIDGEHSFNSLTVKNGGILTGTDFNNYGVYNSGNLNDRLYENLIGSDSAEYTFIVRGVINVGVNPATWIFSPCSGNPSSYTTYNQPNTMNVDDIASVEFFAPASADTFDFADSNWTGTPVGHAFTSRSGGLISYVDNQTDASHTYLPFEYRFENMGGDVNFGLCSASAGPNLATNNYYLATVGIFESFNDTSATPQMKTVTAWQGASANRYGGGVTDYNAFSTYVNNFKVGSGYNPTYFYRSLTYDFKNDKKVALHPSLDMLSSSRTFDDQSSTQNIYDEYRRRNSKTTSDISSFWPSNGWFSPLASRVLRYTLPYPFGTIGDDAIKHYQPYLSESLVASLPLKIPTKLSISGTFQVENGGKVNFNGRGFAYSKFTDGSGPAGATIYGGGASHSGAGGESRYPLSGGHPTKTPYDTNQLQPPKLPGSGSLGWATASFFFWYYYELTNEYTYYHGNGGGYLNISANKIQLDGGSMLMANAIGADVNEAPAGASGGTIILSDSDSTSTYNGLVTAQGASTSRHHGDRTFHGGGGGGYIYITTSTNPGSLQNREDISHYPTHESPSSVIDPDWDYWSRVGLANNSFSVMPGTSEDGETGGKGIFSVHGHITKSIKMKKWLEPVERASQTNPADFNPYGVLLGDKIRVKIQASQLSNNSIVEDEVASTLADGKIVKCKNIADISPPGATVTDVGTKTFIRWTYTGDGTSQDYSYTCVTSL